MNPLEEQKGLVEFLEAALDEARGQSPVDQQQIQRLHAHEPDPGLQRSMADIVHRVDQLNHHAVDLVYSAYDTDLGGPG